MSSQIVILGYHRSGTSALSQNCQAAGLFLGDTLLGAKPSNPFGHFEDKNFFQVNEAILQTNLARWDMPHDLVPVIRPEIRQVAMELVSRRNAQYDLWGFKDPRTCILLDFWHSLLPDPKYLVCLRHYTTCVDSIVRRHVLDIYSRQQLGLDQSVEQYSLDYNGVCANWCVYMANLLTFLETRDADRMVVRIDKMPKEISIIGEMNDAFGVGLDPIPLSQTFRPEVFQGKEIDDLPLDPAVKETADKLWARLDTHISLQ
ncbi:sulfotransferase [Shimia sp. Alg240-R146]|uniref:sulfotransferase n=1 Tax=Shimia sp. Alg240-R146 TaxID=2993449 RepID=UPI0022E645D0|nr:sulfotransferase [Shimia sp. Alg240-R146]